MKALIDKITSWGFMQEPLYRWFMFVGAMLLILAAWTIILGYMKKVA